MINKETPDNAYPEGLDKLYDDVVESRSATKALLSKPLSETEYSKPQMYRKNHLNAGAYYSRKIKLIEDKLKFTTDLVRNRKNLNSASLRTKIRYKRYQVDLELEKEKAKV